VKARTFAAWGLLTALGSASAAKRTPELVQSEQHRPIWLRNEAGEIINPLTGQNAGDPYSPLQTCGASKCHDSAFITRGYHFQQGAERLSDGYDPARPWDLSNGMFGKYRPASVRQLARKKNESATKIDMTVWEWVTSPGLRGEPPCAACHPGGGPLERDREGKRYDAVLRRDPGLARSLDGDYRGSHWDKSGVLEADCLMCHSGAYDWNERVAQLRGWNLKWAATAASGLGLVQGRLFDAATGKLNGDTPRVTYNKRLFNEDGKILAPIIKRPGDRNCLYCHADASLKKRGFTWNDPLNPDVHNQQGMGCVSCHVSGLDHNFAKGTTHVETVRDDLDGTMRECKECHTTGYHGASVPSHVAVPPSHLVKIGCKTCHIPSLKRAAGKSFDVTRGDLHWDVVGAASRVGAAEKWYPAYENVKGQLQPVNPIATLWWGNREADGKVHPLFAREIEAAWALYGGEVRDDNGDGLPEVNRPQEIEAGLRAFARVLAAGGRFSRIQPVYVKGDRLWEIGPDGKLTAHADPACERTAFSISHNVAPAKEALGSKGCTDCHSREGRFFARTYVVDPVNEEGKEARAPVYRTLGLSDTSYTIFSVYWSLARPWIGLVLLLLFFILSLHFTRFGPHDFGGRPVEPRPDDYERIARFSWFERMLHLVVLIVFLFLGFTGLAFSFEGWRWMQLVFGDQLTPRVWHGWLGYVFGGGVILMFVRWCRDAVLVRSDIEWLKKLGGYLGGHEPIEAGRFNAGQKIYFWTVVLGGSVLTATGIVLFFQDRLSLDLVFIAAILHNLAGLFGVAGVLSHIYLSTAANPGTVQAIFAGWVTRAWARLHHPLWYEQVTGRPAAEEAEREEEAPQKKEEPPAGG
jgi:formate dehydrogenase gamma subunit